MGFFDFFKKNKIKDSAEVIDRKSLSPAQIEFTQQVNASDDYCKKLYQMFYKDYPEMPFISKDRELNTNWIEQVKLSGVTPKKEKMVRYSDNLLPGHVYMLYWLSKYNNKKIPAYFEYEYGICFKREKFFLEKNGYLEKGKLTSKGLQAMTIHKEVIEEKHPVPKYQGKSEPTCKISNSFGRSIPASLKDGVISVPQSDKHIIDNEFDQLNQLILCSTKMAHLHQTLIIDSRKFLYSKKFTFYEAKTHTPTGKPAKYPLTLHYAYASHNDLDAKEDYFGEVNYMQNGSIGKARMIFWKNKTGYLIHLAEINKTLSVKKIEISTSSKWETLYKA